MSERSGDHAVVEPELIAYHLTEAGHLQQATEFWLKAGQRSAQRWADYEAVQQLRAALVTLKDLPASVSRDQLELDIQIALAASLSVVLGLTDPQVDAANQRASTLSQSLGDKARLYATLGAQCKYRINRGEYRLARELAEKCELVAETLNEPIYRGISHRRTGIILTALGALSEARTQFEQCLAYGRNFDRRTVPSWLPGEDMLYPYHLPEVLWIMGFPDRAREVSQEALKISAEFGNSDHKLLAWWHAGGILVSRREQSRRLGITVPLSLLARAGVVIEVVRFCCAA
jgi:hypothetical protein